MEKIHEPNDLFDFSKMGLLSPSSMPGGNYFIKFRINDSPLYIQPPKCITKSAIIKSGKKHYCDLMFTNENEQFIRWMENLEMYCQTKIFENRNKWFETQLDQHDIENSFTSPLKIFRSGKYYITRTNVPTMLGKCSLKIYNEDENEVDIETIKENTNVITILEVQGIKCSSKNFQIEIEIKQMMLFKQNNLFERCIFSSKTGAKNQLEADTEERGEDDATRESTILAQPAGLDTVMLDSIDNQPTDTDEHISLEISQDDSSYDINSSNTDIDKPLANMIEQNEIGDNLMSGESVFDAGNQLTQNPVNNIGNITQYETNDILEVDVDVNGLTNHDTVFIKKRNDIYYQMYKEAKRKAKMARDLAISSYLEAKHIKNTYMLENEDSDSDFDEESFENME